MFMFLCFFLFNFSHGQCDYETTEIAIVQQTKLCPSASVTAVIGKKFISEDWQDFNTDETFNRQNFCQMKTFNHELLNIFKNSL